jgi:hypothetical protein
MTKAPCKFHFYREPVPLLLFAARPCSCPVVYRVTGCGACVPDAMQHGRSVLQPLDSPSRTWAAAMMHCRPGTLQSSGVSMGARYASLLRSVVSCIAPVAWMCSRHMITNSPERRAQSVAHVPPVPAHHTARRQGDNTIAAVSPEREHVSRLVRLRG